MDARDLARRQRIAGALALAGYPLAGLALTFAASAGQNHYELWFPLIMPFVSAATVRWWAGGTRARAFALGLATLLVAAGIFLPVVFGGWLIVGDKT